MFKSEEIATMSYRKVAFSKETKNIFYKMIWITRTNTQFCLLITSLLHTFVFQLPRNRCFQDSCIYWQILWRDWGIICRCAPLQERRYVLEGCCQYLRQCGGGEKFCLPLCKLATFLQTAANVLLVEQQEEQGAGVGENTRLEKLSLSHKLI